MTRHPGDFANRPAVHARPSSVWALVVGIDDYPTKPLSGCVNDALAARALVVAKLGATPDRVALLLSPDAGRQELPEHRRGTAVNIRSELQRLADRVGPSDRVFIFFAGHGSSQRAIDRYVESLLPEDFAIPGNVLHDVEVSARLAAIHARTRHVTVILDCCHAAGGTRTPGDGERPVSRFHELPPHGDALAPGASGMPALGDGGPLVVAACLENQVAFEKTFPEGRHGAFTKALFDVLAPLSAQRLAITSWREIWAAVICQVSPSQYPRILGDDTRAIAGSAAPLHSASLLVEPDGSRFRIQAGTLTDVTPGTLISVASRIEHSGGATSEIGVGALRVIDADARSAIGESIGDFAWPLRPLCRVVRYGRPVLRVAVRGECSQDLRWALAATPDAVAAPDSEADVHIVADGAECVLCDECFGLARDGRPELIRFPSRAVPEILTHAARYRAPLRLAQRCADLPRGLRLRVLAVGAQGGANASTPLLECPREPDGSVVVPPTGFCFELANRSPVTLHVTLFNVARSGRVQLLDLMTLEPGIKQRVWHDRAVGHAFSLAGPPGFERLVAIGTTDAEVDLRHLHVPESFQERVGRSNERGSLEGPASPPIAWTSASVVLSSQRPPFPPAAIEDEGTEPEIAKRRATA